MKKGLYLRIAIANIWKNKQTYLPFLIASVMLTFTFYSFSMIATDKGLSQMHGGESFAAVLGFGMIVVGIFTAIFIFYTNSFLIKRRKKELGLYSILGMEKRHIGRILRYESCFCYLVSMVLGLGLGALLGRLLFMLVKLAMRCDITLSGSFSGSSALITAILFLALYAVLIVYNSIQVHTASPVELLRGGQTGEKESKSRWILTIVGLITMGAGYYIAQKVNNPVSAIALFFVAVVLVIIGTYCLFIAGSITILRLMRKKKSYYYSPKHFITISGMLYRMKQNAAGLASICILCTMAMVTIGTTVSLYNGTEGMLNNYYPYDMFYSFKDEDSRDKLLEFSENAAKENNVTIKDFASYYAYTETIYLLDGRVMNETEAESLETELDFYDNLRDIQIMTLDSFNRVQGLNETLADGDVLVYCDKDLNSLTVNDVTYNVRKIDKPPVRLTGSVTAVYGELLVVVKDMDTLEQMRIKNVRYVNDYNYCTIWNLSGAQEDIEAYSVEMAQSKLGLTMSSLNKTNLRQEWYMMHGGFFFVGIFLGIIFLMATAFIIYFKQISEGYQDHDRFVILQKVGMSKKDVKATIHRQILTVFALPLLIAVCHVAGSLHMMTKILMLFGLMDIPYIALNSFMTAFIIAALYGLMYLRTAKTYYKLVKF